MSRHTPTPMNDDTAGLGATFRRLRKGAGVTLRDLAKTTDMAVNTLRWHEAGARMLRADQMLRCAVALKVDPRLMMAFSRDEGGSDGGE